MYNYIRDPKNNRKISVTSKRGKYILKKYLDFYHGGGNTEERFYTALSEHKHPRNNDGEMGRVHTDEDNDGPPQDKADIYDLDKSDPRVQQYLNQKNLVVNKRPGDLNCKNPFSHYNQEKNCIEDVISRKCIDKKDLMHFPNADICGSKKSMCQWYHLTDRLHHPINSDIEEPLKWWDKQCVLMIDYIRLDNQTIRIAVKKYLENDQSTPPISNWGTSGVTDMSWLFYGADSFNQPLHWDTGNVKDMRGMFAGATSFNQPLDWDTSKVENMSHMFRGASSFNQPLHWNTGNVKNMKGMFWGATSFNQPLDWDTSNVENMFYMFREASSFNQELNWDVRNVISMHGMFREAKSFNQPLYWDTGNVEDMHGMFQGATSFKSYLDLYNID